MVFTHFIPLTACPLLFDFFLPLQIFLAVASCQAWPSLDHRVLDVSLFSTDFMTSSSHSATIDPSLNPLPCPLTSSFLPLVLLLLHWIAANPLPSRSLSQPPLVLWPPASRRSQCPVLPWHFCSGLFVCLQSSHFFSVGCRSTPSCPTLGQAR